LALLEWTFEKKEEAGTLVAEGCGEWFFFVAVTYIFCSSYVKVQEPGKPEPEYDAL
jgi:hypothetical protein